MKLVRWDPTREMIRMRNEFDRFFDDSWDLPRWRWTETIRRPAVDVAETDDAYVVKASIPGVKPDDLDISITDNILSIKGEIEDEKTIAEEQYHRRERRYGAFTRSISLPAPVNVDEVEATYEDGVLTLTMPKREEVKAKRIPIKSAEADKLLEGEVVEKS